MTDPTVPTGHPTPKTPGQRPKRAGGTFSRPKTCKTPGQSVIPPSLCIAQGGGTPPVQHTTPPTIEISDIDSLALALRTSRPFTTPGFQP